PGSASGLPQRHGDHLAEWRHRSEWWRPWGSPDQAARHAHLLCQLECLPFSARLDWLRIHDCGQRDRGIVRWLGPLVHPAKPSRLARLLSARRIIRRDHLSQCQADKALAVYHGVARRSVWIGRRIKKGARDSGALSLYATGSYRLIVT